MTIGFLKIYQLILIKNNRKSSGKLLFDTEARSYIKTKDHLNEVENKIYRYFYNINILKSISSKETPIFVFFQPQMIKNYENLSNSDKKSTTSLTNIILIILIQNYFL